MRARDNPFRTGRLGRLAFRHPALSVAAIHRRWLGLGCRAAIVGPHGSGKTTLLRELGDRLASEGLRVSRWFLNADGPAPKTAALVREARTLGDRDVLLFDGAGHLSRRAWSRVARASRGVGGLLVTGHVEGLLPTLVHTRTDAALLAELTGELVGRSARPLQPLLDALRAAHGGNLRDVFLALYDLAAHDDPGFLDLVGPRSAADR
jgi:hypothetical protein